MENYAVVEYMVALGITIAVVSAAWRWKSDEGRTDWFLDYFHYLLFFYLAALASQVVPHLGIRLLGIDGESALKLYFLFQTFLVFPLVALFLLFFLRFSAGLPGGRLPRRFERGYLLASGAAFAAAVFQTLRAFHAGRSDRLAGPLDFTAGVVIAALFLAPIWTALRSRWKRPPSRQASLFATVHCGSLAAYLLILLFWLASDRQFGHHLVRFLFNVPPMLLLVRISERKAPGIASPPGREAEDLFAMYHITPREREIIRLVCQGKTGREIESELFISIKTVKAHLYNIYQKVGVKNRVQLAGLFLSQK